MSKTYPALVSRTLDPNKKALVTVVARHDAEITDADVNLIQDLQDSKRQRLLDDKSVTSGCLTYAPMRFDTGAPNTFLVPSFDVLFNGEVITVAGNLSPDLTLNRVVLPPPVPWASGSPDEPARVYVCFVELWYQALNPVTGTGYFIDPVTGLRFFYPYGGVSPDPSNAEIVPDDSIDPFQGLFTTMRAQIQWRINVQRVALNYDFSTYPFGLTFDSTATVLIGGGSNLTYGQAVQARAGRNAPIPDAVGLTTYKFVNGAFAANSPVFGDAGIWVAGDGNVNNSLGTMDGYSYAIPLAVVFQRNTGTFDIANNPFGCANASISGSGTLVTNVSGRYDYKLADQIFADDTVDTRGTVSLDGWESEAIMRAGFADLVMGNIRLAIARSSTPANGLGSALPHYVTAGPNVIANTDNVGNWPMLSVGGVQTASGIANGFSSDARTFPTAVLVSINQKSVGAVGQPWTVGDAFTVSIPSDAGATIQTVELTALVDNTILSTKTPAALLQGQVNINVGKLTATVTFNKDLKTEAPAFYPGTNPISVLIGVQFAAGSNRNLRQIPISVNGILADAVSGKTLAVYGVSEYVVQTNQPPLNTARIVAVNPEYSDVVVGTKAWLHISGTDPSVSQIVVNNINTTQVVIPRNNLGGSVGLNGLYVTRAWDLTTGTFYSINKRAIIGGANPATVIQVTPVVPPTSTLVVSVLVQDTAQLAFNAPVKGVTAIEETVLAGNYTLDPTLKADPRVQVISTSFNSTTNVSTVVLAANGCTLEGISGDDVNKLIWINNSVTPTLTLSAAATAANGITQYTGTIGTDNAYAGFTFVVTGFSNPANNGTFLCVQNSSTVLYLRNTSGTSESHAATATTTAGGSLVGSNLSSTNIAEGITVVTGPTAVDLTTAQFFLVMAVRPAFDQNSQLTLSLQYIPYQGEGVLNRDYEFVHAEDDALVTTNGTGAAPIAGLADVFPYNRELPIVTMLPSQVNWNDADLTNEALASFFDSNYVAMRVNDVETVFLAPMHANDFIPPINRDIRKAVRFITQGGRGWAKATPHVGFAIAAPTPRTVLGQNLQSTIAPVTLYVDNVNGNDNNSGLDVTNAKFSIGAALAELPPVLRHPCVIVLQNTGQPFSLVNITGNIETIALGDGDIRSAKQYALGNLSRVIQEEGRLVIAQSTVNATSPVVIDATGFTGFGDGPTAAFYIDTSRVILSGIQFVGFTNPVIVAYNSDVDMVGCQWAGNVQAGSYVSCSSVILDGGFTTLPDLGAGHVCVQSNLTSSNHGLAASGANPGTFYTGTRNSTLNLQKHVAGTNDVSVSTFIVADAELNSSILAAPDFQTNGAAILEANSVLSQTAVQTPFLGQVQKDASSSIVTQVA